MNSGVKIRPKSSIMILLTIDIQKMYGIHFMMSDTRGKCSLQASINKFSRLMMKYQHGDLDLIKNTIH